MLKHLLLSILVMLCGQWSDAQITQAFLGSDSLDQIAHIIPTHDGHFMATGTITDGNTKKVWLLKFTSDGSLVWERTFAPTKSNVDGYGHKITLLDNEGVLICGEQRTKDKSSPGSGLIIRTNLEGKTSWQKEYPSVDAIYDATISDSNFLVVGWEDFTGAGFGGFVMLVDATNGNILWKNPVTVSSKNKVRRIFPTNDGNFIIVGRMDPGGFGGGVYIRKISPSGDIMWETRHNTNWNEISSFSNINYYNQSLGATLKPDGTVWVVDGYRFNSDIMLLQFSADGELLQEKFYGHPTHRELPYGLIALADESFLITGEAIITNGSITDYQGFAMLVDSNGSEVWRQYYGENGFKDQLFSGVGLEDGHFLLVGASDNSLGNGNTDGWLLHTEPDGNVMPWTIEGTVQFDFDNNCIHDVDAIPSKGWFLEVSGKANHLLVTDDQGKFKVKVDSGINIFTLLAPEPEGAWQICNASQTVVSNSSTPIVQLNFLVQSTDGGCPHTTVGITQPDLVRCSTGTFLVTVQNLGSGNSDELILDIIADPALTIVSVSEPFSHQGNSILFDIDPMEGFQQKTVAIKTRLSCDVQIGAAHGMVARLMPVDCAPLWSGPRFAVEGACLGGKVSFQMKNNGGGGANASSRYRVMADDLLIMDWTNITLPEAGDAYLLDFPADGRTWRVEMEHAAGFTSTSNPAVSIEGCGFDKNGLYSIGFRNTWRYDDGVPEVAVALAPNTTGVPNKVAEGLQGFGEANFVGDEAWLEYSARVSNNLQTAAQSADFRFTFSSTLDPSTFQVLASNGPVALEIDNFDVLRANMRNIDVPPGDFAMLRFRIKPKSGVPANMGKASQFAVYAQGYFNGYGPQKLSRGFNTYSESFPLSFDPFNNYSSEILRFGGRGFDFGIFMALAPDGSVFMGGETTSYSYLDNTDGFLIKANAQGEAYWLTALDLGDQGTNFFRGAFPLDDGGCIVAGNYKPGNALGNDFADNKAFIARFDANGYLLWHKKYWPAGPQFGAWVQSLIPTLDGHFIMYGSTQNEKGTDQFYLKINEDGDIIWKYHEPLSGLGFEPIAAVQTLDSGFVIIGEYFFDSDLFIEKIDANGNKLWNKGYPSLHYMKPSGVAIMPDGGYLVSGYSFWKDTSGSYVDAPTFVRFSSEGEAEWEKNPIIGPFNYATAFNIIPDPNGGYFSVGEVLIDTVERFQDVMLLKLDELGELVWWRNFGSMNREWANAALVSAPDQLLLWGFNQPRPPLNDLQALLVRVDLDGNPPVSIKPESTVSKAEAFVFPNPAYDRIHVSIQNELTANISWQLCNMLGATVQNGVAGNADFAIDLNGLQAGLYFLIFPQQGIQTKRVMVIR